MEYIKLFLISPFLLVNSIFRKFKNKDTIHLWGIYGYFGLCGQGKTISMVHRLNCLRKKYGDKILISTNFGYIDEDFSFYDWKVLCQDFDKPLVIAWDEVQNEFCSRKYRDFPINLLTVLTQNRKGHGVQIHYTSQRFNFVDKAFRELTNICYDCKTFFGNYTVVKGYDFSVFDSLDNIEKKPKSIDGFSFYHKKSLYSKYDTLKFLESVKKDTYFVEKM